MDLPTLHTRRLLLRPRALDDTEACLVMDNEPEVNRFVLRSWHDQVEHRAFIDERTTCSYPPGLGYWTICRHDPPEIFLGWLLLIPADCTGAEVEIGWRLRRASWGNGFATEAGKAVITHAFETIGHAAVIADIDPANAASMRVAEKLGMRLTAIVDHQGVPAWRYRASA